jgi:hypothetical protein
MSSSRLLYVLVYPSRLFAAHWSFWIPDIGADGRETHVGDRIHVTGDRLNGFEYEYICGYDVKGDDRHPNAFPIGLLLDDSLRSLHYGPGNDGAKGPVNVLDKILQDVPAPGPSLNQVAAPIPGDEGKGLPKRKEVRDCQWWIRQAVTRLVENSILQAVQKDVVAREDVLTILSRVPKH